MRAHPLTMRIPLMGMFLLQPVIRPMDDLVDRKRRRLALVRGIVLSERLLDLCRHSYSSQVA